MDHSVFILCKQEQVQIKRLHICTWDMQGAKYFTEYGLEISRGSLNTLDLSIALPEIATREDCICLYPNVSEGNNCRFIFNSDIQWIGPIDGNPKRGVNVTLCCDRTITLLPLGDSIQVKDKILYIELDIPQQAKDVIYIRFLIRSKNPAFSFVKKEISTKIINYDVRVNECRTASFSVQKIQQKGYKVIPIEKCFCFHIIPNTYTVDFLDHNKLKTIRSLEAAEFNAYLEKIKEAEKIKLEPREYNIVFCKQERLPNYSFFSVYRKEYIGNSQLILALGANLLCSLLFALGGLRAQTVDPDTPFLCRIPGEYWVAFGVFVALLVGYFWKRRK